MHACTVQLEAHIGMSTFLFPFKIVPPFGFLHNSTCSSFTQIPLIKFRFLMVLLLILYMSILRLHLLLFNLCSVQASFDNAKFSSQSSEHVTIVQIYSFPRPLFQYLYKFCQCSARFLACSWQSPYRTWSKVGIFAMYYYQFQLLNHTQCQRPCPNHNGRRPCKMNTMP